MSREMEMRPIDERPADAGSRRRRVMVGVAAAMLVAGAGGAGYGLGRSVGDDAPSAAPETTAAVSTTPPEDEGSATDRGSEPTDTFAPAATAVEESAAAGSESFTSADDAISSGGWGWSMYGAEPMTTLFERTTDAGLTVRAQQGQLWNDPYVESPVGAGEWTPAPWCYESGQLRIAVAGNGLIDVAGAGWWREPFKGRAVSWLAVGGPDAQPHWVVVVQAPADTTLVSVAFADGGTDSVAPQNGVAVLVVPAGESGLPGPEAGYEAPEFTVAFEGGAEPIELSSDAVNTWDDPEFQESCTPPPPALPEPGEQPADPATAEAQITDVMARIYDAANDDEGLVTDDTGLAEAREQVAEGGFAGEADSAQATIEELVFTSPTEAWFRYRIDTNGVGLRDRYGIAQFVDGSWKVTRDTVCQDLSMAGGDCGGGWQQIFPPSAEPMYID